MQSSLSQLKGIIVDLNSLILRQQYLLYEQKLLELLKQNENKSAEKSDNLQTDFMYPTEL